MQLCNLRFQDGCLENQYATYLLQSMTPKFLSAGRRCNLATCHFRSTYPKFLSAGTWCKLATLDLRMDPLKLCNLATCRLRSTYPKFSSAGTWCNFATFDFRMDALKISMQPTYFRACPQIFVCRQKMQPSNLPFRSTYPKSLSAGTWCSRQSLSLRRNAAHLPKKSYFRMDAFIICNLLVCADITIFAFGSTYT